MAPDISKSKLKSVTENDLEHFRQEWRAEVELKKSGAQQLDDHSDQASNARNNNLHVDDSTDITILSLENVEHSFRELSLSEQLNREKDAGISADARDRESRRIFQQEQAEYEADAGLSGFNQQDTPSEKKEKVERDDVPRTALEHYFRAVVNEREGNLNEGRD